MTTTAVVTGAGRGIGFAFARHLADAGHLVVLTDIDGDAARRAAAEIGRGAMDEDAVARAGLALMDSRQIFRVMPRWRGALVRGVPSLSPPAVGTATVPDRLSPSSARRRAALG
ncbi:SDR family NAD(P)-dependent oxidoreductase [Nocardia rhamnosiphila]|uniref:SDR family NAD(P)-dependent oxidoreductase n=1 Tax=Nocardia rhamnosiphila TaxID=426716 RepID=UPI003F4CF3B2